MSQVLMGNDARCPCECESPCVLNADLDHAEHRIEQLERMLTQCRTALASILTGESDCQTERDARKLCADALVKLNTELNTKNTKHV